MPSLPFRTFFSSDHIQQVQVNDSLFCAHISEALNPKDKKKLDSRSNVKYTCLSYFIYCVDIG